MQFFPQFTESKMPDDSTNATYFTGRYNDECRTGLLIPFIPYESSWDTNFRAFLYLAGLFYCFLGVAIVADVFMGAIEKITSKTKKVCCKIMLIILLSYVTSDVMIS